MLLRQQQEQLEISMLSAYASMSAQSKGRDFCEEKCDVRTDYQRDRDRILHSKAFRRLKDKTQVFISPEKDHLRTRLTHTLEVAQISRTIARALKLNEDLTEAIALGHDLGHTPFGHSGEHTLNEIAHCGFAHNEQSVRIVEKLERNGRGLNLTKEVRDGIRNHRTGLKPATLEGKVVQIADKIAYINHDVDDAVQAGALAYTDIPAHFLTNLGDTSGKRINTMIRAVIEQSYEKDDVSMAQDVKKDMAALRTYMFQNVYLTDYRMQEEKKVFLIIKELYYYYLENEDLEILEYAQNHAGKKDGSAVIVCDYISGMTDRYAMNKYTKIFLPQYWNVY